MELNKGGEGFTDPQVAAWINQVWLGDAYGRSDGSGRAGPCAWDKGIGWGTIRCGGELHEGNDGYFFPSIGPMHIEPALVLNTAARITDALMGLFCFGW